MLRIGLIGSTGRLGKAISALSDTSFQISASFSQRYLPNPTADVDVFIDVSTVCALPHNLRAALLAKKPIVVGTTGHTDLSALKEAAQLIPIFYSPNFSLGMALMCRAAAEYARKFHRQASIDLVETHHAQKRDAPSGSALMLSELVENAHPTKPSIQSIRSGNAAGEHALHFRTPEESLTLTHTAFNRDAFAKGAIAAARFLISQKVGFFQMDQLLDSSHCR